VLNIWLVLRTALGVAWVMALAACASPEAVQPWEKGNLARPEMAMTTDRLDAKFMDHTYFSKEAATGGSGVGGGGCGCN
jgi:hypothetical protein